jgi:alpha-L-fucosidase
VAKGGNFLLNVGPDADGNLPDTALLRMKEIGEWMKVNGEAIYGTRPVYPYAYGKFRFTQKNNKVYAIFLLDEQESPVPDTYWFNAPDMKLKTGKIKVLGSNKKASLRRETDGRYRIDFPSHFEMPHAVVFEMRN